MTRIKSSTLRHQQGESCALCEAKLLTAHTLMMNWFHAAKFKWPNMHISWAFRDQKAQDQAVKENASLLSWPNSAHNHMIGTQPNSLALDIFQIDEDGMARFEFKFNSALWDWTIKDYCAKNMRWGGAFKDLGDSGHFQVRAEKPEVKVH